ncbi:hypothetical protein ACR6HW_04895 [Fusibacter sp. JL298sf-3]
MKTKIHNRFDIEVIREGQTIQRASAENIVLNQMYEKLCNFRPYFKYIHFGTGSGTPSADRNQLFAPLGSKLAEDVERVKALPLSKWTKKITLAPEEYVGATLREVGIGFGSAETHAVTHAMIKDAEGNPLSIEKTNIDVVVIYATVFIELSNTERVYFTEPAESNLLLEYLTGGVMPSNLEIGLAEVPLQAPHHSIVTSVRKAPTEVTVTPEVANRKVLLATRFPIESPDVRCAEVGLMGVSKKIMPVSFSISDFKIGVGDGITDTFETQRPELSAYTFKVAGVTDPAAVVTNPSVTEAAEKLSILSIGEAVKGIAAPYLYGEKSDLNTDIVIATPSNIVGKTIGFEGSGSPEYGKSSRFDIVLYGANDGENFTELTRLYFDSSTVNKTGSFTFTQDYSHIQVTCTKSYYFGSVFIESLHLINDAAVKPTVKFAAPPAEGAVISADFTVPYYPKTQEYVLDIDYEIQFGGY